MLVVTPFIQIPAEEFEFSYARSSGPGGQNVNKVNSKAVLRWDFQNSPSVPLSVRMRFIERFGSKLTVLGELIVTSDRFRDRLMNQNDCREKLKEMLLLVAYPPKPRKKTKPTKGSKERTKTAKKNQAQKKRARGRPGWDD